MNDQDEMFERATETPIGEVKVEGEGEQRNVPLAHFPSGADGTEPAPSDEAKKALADGVERMRDKLSKIADIALAADAKCVNIEKIGKRWMECSKAIFEIRKICGPDLIEKAVFSTGMYYTPGWLANLAKEVAAREKPLDPTAPEMKVSKQEAFNRRTWSFCDGLFPIIHIDTPDGFMARCKINGRTFRESVVRMDSGGDKGPVFIGYIYDKDKLITSVGGYGHGKTAVKLMTHAAFMAYVKQLSGGGKKYHNRRGFLRQNAARARAAASA